MHEVEHGIGVAQSLGSNVEKLDGRLSPFVGPAEVFVYLLNETARRGTCHVSGGDATTWSLRGGDKGDAGNTRVSILASASYYMTKTK